MLNSRILLGAATVWLAPTLVSAATLTNVPMQGGMVMPMVRYHAATDNLTVMMPATIPQLTPLLVSNPGDRFDPADPWYDSIDPARQGASFSRRYGFVMNGSSDIVPPTRQMWIRKLSGDAAVKAYRYRDTAPKAWEPIFGTDGVTNALYWNAMMFHPAFTAPPGTNNLTATFELYLVDSATGIEIPNSSSGPLVFDWTNVNDGRPALNLSATITVAWPAATTTNWLLESASAANATIWTAVTNTPVTIDGQPCVVLPRASGPTYFRMRHVP